MGWALAKLIIAGSVISFTSWLAGKRPGLAGFLLAVPISTMLALVFTQSQFGDSSKSVEFAKSVFLAVPLSLLFFVPFLLAERLRWPFWGLYSGGVVLIFVGYLFHSQVFR